MNRDKDIFSYGDYRDFLKVAIQDRRKKSSRFGVRQLAMRAGFRSPGSLSMVVSKKRHLSVEAGERVARALNLQGRQKSYFQELIKQTHSVNDRERTIHQERILKIKQHVQQSKLQGEQYRFLSRWYYVAIYEMVALPDFKADPKWIQKRLRSTVTVPEIDAALEDIQALGLISINEGRWMQTNQALKTDDEIAQVAVRQYHHAMLDQAKLALELPLSEREFGGVTVKVPAEDLVEIKNRVRAFKDDLNEFLSSRKGKGEVCQLNIQFFPLTKERKQ